MQFGVHLPHIGPWHDGDTLRRFAVAVEEMGYDSVWVSDHIVFPLGFQSRYPYAEGGRFPLPPVVPWLEPVTTLTFVAGATSRVKLGTSILVLPYRNPVLNAKQLGNLQTVSGGRLIVGAGAGWMREEAEALGMPWDERGARTDEHIQVLRALWTEEDPKFEGRFYRVTGLRCEPRPVTPPPVWVGGHEPPALRRAARLGDGWHAYRLTPEELAEGWRKVQSLAREAGRDPDGLALSVRWPLSILDAPGDGSQPFIGTVEQVGETLRRYQSLGVAHVVFEPPILAGIDAALATLERFAREVRGEFG
ncbi:MAG: LLM class F420-dependent oxidoreductase [Dehalococcoidia bacterium]|nr:LLM class F420-dependent oxidoreductase [Dehalococcoidia bacterium]